MDHVVYLDAKARELNQLLAGDKTMIIRGAAGRKLPHGRVFPGDTLYFIENNADGQIRARGVVKTAIHTDKLTPDESARLIAEYQPGLQLTSEQIERWSGKRYLVLIEVEAVATIAPFPIDKSRYGNMDDWLPVGDIQSVTLPAG